MVILIAQQFLKNVRRSNAIYSIIVVALVMLAYAAYSGWKNYETQNDIRSRYQKLVRQSWENNPDKHPHRMAHFGTFAFRLKHKLSMFDFGLESFVGNAVFLEAHKQNTVNFSEASFSTGLLRFGEISMAMLLQIIFPLIIFFAGFDIVAKERENSTLKILLTQGAGWKEILIGKCVGLMGVVMILFLPIAIVAAILLFFNGNSTVTGDDLIRYAFILSGYFAFFLIVCVITVLISATSNTAKESLIRLLGIWLFFVILLPKTTQAIGSHLYPSPSKVEFEMAVEDDLIKKGDSHNPNDPHYNAIRDSLLNVYQVDSVQQLPFNYSGFVMKEGEKISSSVYDHHLTTLLDTYQKQNSFGRYTALVNPYAAIKNISMAFSGTDFSSYISFQRQAEHYRYQLAQHMNDLQIKLISNRKLNDHDKPHSISREHWRAFPDFAYQFPTIGSVVRSETLSIAGLLVWAIGTVLFVILLSKKAKVI